MGNAAVKKANKIQSSMALSGRDGCGFAEELFETLEELVKVKCTGLPKNFPWKDVKVTGIDELCQALRTLVKCHNPWLCQSDSFSVIYKAVTILGATDTGNPHLEGKLMDFLQLAKLNIESSDVDKCKYAHHLCSILEVLVARYIDCSSWYAACDVVCQSMLILANKHTPGDCETDLLSVILKAICALDVIEKAVKEVGRNTSEFIQTFLIATMICLDDEIDKVESNNTGADCKQYIKSSNMQWISDQGHEIWKKYHGVERKFSGRCDFAPVIVSALMTISNHKTHRNAQKVFTDTIYAWNAAFQTPNLRRKILQRLGEAPMNIFEAAIRIGVQDNISQRIIEIWMYIVFVSVHESIHMGSSTTDHMNKLVLVTSELLIPCSWLIGETQYDLEWCLKLLSLSLRQASDASSSRKHCEDDSISAKTSPTALEINRVGIKTSPTGSETNAFNDNRSAAAFGTNTVDEVFALDGRNGNDDNSVVTTSDDSFHEVCDKMLKDCISNMNTLCRSDHSTRRQMTSLLHKFIEYQMDNDESPDMTKDLLAAFDIDLRNQLLHVCVRSIEPYNLLIKALDNSDVRYIKVLLPYYSLCKTCSHQTSPCNLGRLNSTILGDVLLHGSPETLTCLYEYMKHSRSSKQLQELFSMRDEDGNSYAHAMIKNMRKADPQPTRIRAQTIRTPASRDLDTTYMDKLIKLGIPLNLRNNAGDMPLHTLLPPSDRTSKEYHNSKKLLQLFIDNGAHLDAVNIHGQCAWQMLGTWRVEVDRFTARSLQCRAAVAIKQYELIVSTLPSSLIDFVNMH